MKNRVLLAVLLQFFLVLNSCSSDSVDDSVVQEEIKEEIKVDYIVEGSINDFVINNDNLAYTIGKSQGIDDFFTNLEKIDLTGKKTLLKQLKYIEFAGEKLANFASGDILMTSYDSQTNSDKIYRFENNFSELNPFYTMKTASSPFARPVRLAAIHNNGDNSYFVFDYSTNSMKRVVPELNTDILIAGSEKKEIKDGTGLNASFAGVYRIISQNKILYIVDNNLVAGTSSTYSNSSIRKIEFINKGWEVITLIESKTDVYKDIAFDSSNNLYVAIKGKGIFKVNLQDNTLLSFREGQIKIGTGEIHKSIDLQSINAMKIKNNDLYLLDSNSALIKISDFQTKFETK